jgi:hypothetical protein
LNDVELATQLRALASRVRRLPAHLIERFHEERSEIAHALDQLATAFASPRTTARIERRQEAQRQQAKPTYTFANGKKVTVQPRRPDYAIHPGK